MRVAFDSSVEFPNIAGVSLGGTGDKAALSLRDGRTVSIPAACFSLDESSSWENAPSWANASECRAAIKYAAQCRQKCDTIQQKAARMQGSVAYPLVARMKSTRPV